MQVKWHPKGNVVLAGSDDMTMWMWLALTGAYMQVLIFSFWVGRGGF